MLKVFSGTGNPSLSEKVANILKIKLSPAEIVHFHNSEVRVRVETPVAHDTCVVIQPTSVPTNDRLMELFFFCDALRRQEAKRVIGFIPYFGYARQDIQHRNGECVSANVVIRFLESIGFHKIYTIDLHDEATQGVFSIPYSDLTALELLAHEVRSYLKTDNPTPSDFTIVSPDQGGIERARKFGTYFYGNEFFSIDVVEKKRDQDHIHETTALNLYGDVKGKTAILVDDIITSGKTLVNAAELCLKHGARQVLAAVVHHEFSPDTVTKIMSSSIDRFFSTDSIMLDKSLTFEKLTEVSVAPVIADKLKKL